MQTQTIEIDGKKAVGVEVDLPGAPLVLVKGARGFVMCGYLDLHTADRLNVPAAIVRGVKTVDDLLAGSVVAVSGAAVLLGMKPGMTGRQALSLVL